MPHPHAIEAIARAGRREAPRRPVSASFRRVSFWAAAPVDAGTRASGARIGG
jgi:hypothetical protein